MKIILEKASEIFVTETKLVIKKQVQINGLYVVLFDTDRTIKYGDNAFDRNIIAFDKYGQIIWQIQSCSKNHSPSTYTNLMMENNQLVAHSWIGVRLLVDLNNGQVTAYKANERPW